MTKQSRRIPAASFRLPGDTLRQIEELTEILGMTKTGVLSRAIDRLHQQEAQNMDIKQQARQLAVKHIEFADSEGEPVANTTVVGINGNGYWVIDNGEEVNGLTKEEAVEIIVENLVNDGYII